MNRQFWNNSRNNGGRNQKIRAKAVSLDFALLALGQTRLTGLSSLAERTSTHFVSNWRRHRLKQVLPSFLLVAAPAFKNFNLVPVRIGHKKEPCKNLASRCEFNQLAWVQSLSLQSRSLRFKIGH